MKPIVKLSDQDLNAAHSIASTREWDARQNKRRNTNNLKVTPSQSIKLHEQGAAAEYAAWKWLRESGYPVHWETGDYKGKVADLDGWIDVKGVTKPWFRLQVQERHKVPEWAYLLVWNNHPDYHIKGWVWGSELMNVVYPNVGRPCYRIENGWLRHPDKLLEEKERRASEVSLAL